MFTFDPEKHLYTLDGIVIPSVTQIITSFTGEFPYDMTRGKAVHLACELWDKGQLDEESLPDAVHPFLEGYKKFLREHKVIWDLIEQPLRDSIYVCGGTSDRAGLIDGVGTLLELKSNSCPPWVDLQTAEYLEMLKQHPSGKYSSWKVRRVLTLLPFDYRLSPSRTDPNDVKIFRSMHTVYHWKLKNLR